MSIRGATTRDAPLQADGAVAYDALLLVSYGGPEGRDDVLPFLENATRGRGVPRERLLSVAEHYYHFGGVSPINAQNRALASTLEAALDARGRPLRVYLGNRNWHPFLDATVGRMREDGVRRALAIVTSAFSSYSGCRQYREDLIRAVDAAGSGAPAIDKVRVFFNHPLFVQVNAANVRAALGHIDIARRGAARVVFTAHSIPHSMAQHCAYEMQLRESASLVAAAAGVQMWDMAFQSRSGPPHVPWLGPDIVEYLRTVAREGASDVVALPLGFISDHMEVMYDLDVEAAAEAHSLGLRFVRARTVGVDPLFVDMLCELIDERTGHQPVRRALGTLGPSHDICPLDCCLDGRPAAMPARKPIGASR